jgi:hypothetical protein
MLSTGDLISCLLLFVIRASLKKLNHPWCLGVTVNKHTVISTLLFYHSIAATNQQNQKHEEEEPKCHRTDQTKPEIEERFDQQ